MYHGDSIEHFSRSNLENLKAIGKEDDFVFQALAYMEDAYKRMSWANTMLEHVEKVPEELKQEIKKVHAGILDMQERLKSVESK
ncbi:hypothetical protein COO03_04650 [Bacillus sp. AFS098217]|nr:hypothetical protein COO03_04650 [Bacillus sp. AFS098217]